MTATVFNLIHSRTAAQPITISQIRSQTGLSDRAIKQVVRDLRLAGQPIASSKGSRPGYYYALTADEVSRVSERLFNEGRALMVAGSRMAGKHDQAERLGQLRIEDARELPIFRARTRLRDDGTPVCALDACDSDPAHGGVFCCDQHRALWHWRIRHDAA